MLEADIVRAILTHLRTMERCFCWKEHGGPYGANGIPDIICCYKGHFFGFEVKTAKGKPTKLQEAVIRKINAAGDDRQHNAKTHQAVNRCLVQNIKYVGRLQIFRIQQAKNHDHDRNGYSRPMS